MNDSETGSLESRFELQAATTPDRVALYAGARRVTFSELDRDADRIASALGARGLPSGGHVGVELPRSVEAIAAILGVLKAGGVYVPIDPRDPVARRRFIAGDAGLELHLCKTQPAEPLLDPARVVTIDELEDDTDAPRRTPEGSPASERGERPIHLLYTSGSTGRPKAVIGLEGPTLNRLEWMWNAFPFGEDEICLHRTTLGFVDAVWEIFGPLLGGIPLVVVAPQSTGDAVAIATAVKEHRVTRLTAVPSILDALAKSPRGVDDLGSLRLVISSGERLAAPLLMRLRAALPTTTTVLNLYGSTEVAGDVTCAVLTPDTPVVGDVPIGKAIANARLFVLDDERRPVKDGEEGELYVGGPVLARGYHRRPEEHAARFVELPSLTSGPLFRTGDRVRREPDGELRYVGRQDRQVKVRGVRIELDEVEAALLRGLGASGSGAVMARPRPSSSEVHLVAFVAPETLDVDALRRELCAELPSAMVPAVVVPLPSMPLLTNGKIDRLALGRLELTADAPTVLQPGSVEDLIVSMWAEQLPVPPTSVDSDFHALGGDSLDLVEFLVALENVLHTKLTIGDLPRPLTARALAPLVASRSQAVEDDPSVDVVPLAPAHYPALLELVSEAFALREPMAVALDAQPADYLPFARAILARCEDDALSYVALSREDGRIIGFCLSHDLAGDGLAFTPSARLAPIFEVLEELHRRYDAREPPMAREVLEIAATGAAADVDGYAVAHALERRACADAKQRGFRRVVTLCSNAVTRYLATTQQGLSVVHEIDYATFEHHGRRVFASASRHRGVALIEGALA